MKKLMFVLLVSVNALAVSVCENNVCGRLVCEYGCIMRSVNNVCVEKRCTGGAAPRPQDDRDAEPRPDSFEESAEERTQE